MVSDETLHSLVDNSDDRWGRPFTTANDVAEVRWDVASGRLSPDLNS